MKVEMKNEDPDEDTEFIFPPVQLVLQAGIALKSEGSIERYLMKME